MTYECEHCARHYFHELDARICQCEANRLDLNYQAKAEETDDRGDVVGWSDGDMDSMDAAYENGDMGGWAHVDELTGYEDFPEGQFTDLDPAYEYDPAEDK